MIGYSNSSTAVEMGSSGVWVDFAANNYSSATFIDYLQFTTTSNIYSAAPNLPLYTSDAQCSIKL
jgi:hypothetical protein